MKKRNVLGFVVMFTVLALIAAACSGDDAPATTTAATTAAPAATTAAPAATTTAPAATTAAPATTTAAPTTTEVAITGPASDFGVTNPPCADAVINPGNGCIYLGVISDLTIGPFAALATPAYGGIRAFWYNINLAGGINGFDVIINEDNTYDAKYLPEETVQGYTQIEPNILMLAQSLGTSQTLAALPHYIEDNMVAVPGTWWSGWAFDASDGNGLVLEAGANYCFEAMNDFDFAVSQFGADMKYGVVYFPNDYGFDYSAGIKLAAAANGIDGPIVDHVQIPESVGGDVTEAVTAILGAQLDVVFITTGPNEMAKTLGGVVQNGGATVFIGTHPTWNPGLVVAVEALVPAFEALYFQSDWIPGWYGDSVGHQKAKAAAAAEGQSPNGWYLIGWASQYPVKALLTQAIADGDLTRAALAATVKKLENVDFEGMIPNADLANTPGSTSRASLINKIDASAPGGTVNLVPLSVGSTAGAYDFTEPCFAIGG